MEKLVKGFRSGVSKKDSAGKEIIMEVGLAVIGVALLIIFREQIANLVTTLMSTAGTKINELFNVTVS